MQNHQQSDRLSWGDTVFLHMEREGMPLNVASVCIFDGQISREDCIQFVHSKLPLLPRYLKRMIDVTCADAVVRDRTNCSGIATGE